MSFGHDPSRYYPSSGCYKNAETHLCLSYVQSDSDLHVADAASGGRDEHRSIGISLSQSVCGAARKRPPDGMAATKNDDASLSRNGCACVGVDHHGRKI